MVNPEKNIAIYYNGKISFLLLCLSKLASQVSGVHQRNSESVQHGEESGQDVMTNSYLFSLL